MRLWMIDPRKLCRRHLLGEHVECHMFVGTIARGVSIQGYIDNDLFEPLSLRKRHEQLAVEMVRRGFRHKSELPECDMGSLSDVQLRHVVCQRAAQAELVRRCPDCAKRIRFYTEK